MLKDGGSQEPLRISQGELDHAKKEKRNNDRGGEKAGGCGELRPLGWRRLDFHTHRSHADDLKGSWSTSGRGQQRVGAEEYCKGWNNNETDWTKRNSRREESRRSEELKKKILAEFVGEEGDVQTQQNGTPYCEGQAGRARRLSRCY